MSSKIFARSSSPLVTQFSATPPARQRLRAPVSAFAWRAMRRTISVVTLWMLAARSISRCVIVSSGWRGGPPKSVSNEREVIVRPPAKLKCRMFSRSEPSSLRSISSRRIVSAYFGSPYGARPMSLYSPEFTRKPQKYVNAE